MEQELSPTGRAKRMDAGKIRQKPRDVQALTWLSQMYGAPLDVLAKVLGTTELAAREVARRWRHEKTHWAEQARVDAGPAWVWPTTATVNAMLPRDHGGVWSAWKPGPMMAAHVRAVAEVRLALAGTDLDAWISERVLAHREHGLKKKGEKLPHIPDGVWLRGGPTQDDSVLIEVELTPKSPDRIRDILRTSFRRLDTTRATEVWYVCGTPAVADLVRRVAVAMAQQQNETEMERGLKIMQLSDLIGRGDGS